MYTEAMSVAQQETTTNISNGNIVRWIGDVRSIDKNGFLALLYPDEDAFKGGTEAAVLEMPRQEIAEGLWEAVKECVVFHCDVELEGDTPGEDPVVRRVHGMEFDTDFSERMNMVALSSLSFVKRLAKAAEALS